MTTAPDHVDVPVDPGLVVFPPTLGLTVWRDAGEGGMFVWLVVPAPNHPRHECHVDSTLHLTSPDVLITKDTAELWVPYRRHRDSDAHLQEEAKGALWAAGKEELANWTDRVMNADEMSTDLLAAVFLGSTMTCPVHEQAGWWEAGYGDLTQAGKVLFDTLKAAFKVEPLILTFLDT